MFIVCLSMETSPALSTAMLTMSGLKSLVAIVAVGRSILMDCMRIMVRLAIMNDASRKNMMSISGMISMRAFFSGNGVPIFMAGNSRQAGRRRRGSMLLPEDLGFKAALLGGGHHDFDVGGG